MSAPQELFASCAPGLEPLLAAELRGLGALTPEETPGGVIFRGHRRAMYRANLESGLATHVLLRVASFVARRFEVLERELYAIHWEELLTPGTGRVFRVSSKKSRLLHTGAIEERAQVAIAKRLGDADDDDEAPIPIHIRLVKDRVQVSIDTSGAALHRRGYRIHGGAAPLREDLARALVIASGWDRASPLLDPLCGTGTIPIEAAMLAARMPPGGRRSFAFQRTKLLHEPTWASVRANAEEARQTVDDLLIVGRDRDPTAVEASRQNAARAGVKVSVSQANLSAPFETDARVGAVVTHPPFGRRMSASRDLGPLYRALGAVVPEGWRLALMAADRKLGLRANPRLRTAFLTDAGGIKVRALCTPEDEGP